MTAAVEPNDLDTEQTLTCLHMKMYHPHQHDRSIFSAIDLGRREEINAEEMVFFGRAINICKFKLLNNKVSRLQFCLQFFKPFDTSIMSFEIKNLSKRVKLFVNNITLEYLNKVVLPPSCIIRFGEFQILVETEFGESEEKFEICCELSRFPLVQEIDTPVKIGIPESGTQNGPVNGLASSPLSNSKTPPPVEDDENDC